jgi:hypothetical protein
MRVPPVRCLTINVSLVDVSPRWRWSRPFYVSLPRMAEKIKSPIIRASATTILNLPVIDSIQNSGNSRSRLVGRLRNASNQLFNVSEYRKRALVSS